MARETAGGCLRWSGLRKAGYVSRPSATVGWPPALMPGQRVEVVQGIREGQLYFEIRYSARGPNRRAARASATDLARDLEFSLAAAFSTYTFERDDSRPVSSRPDWKYSHRFRPEALRVLVGRAPGFNNRDCLTKHVRLPQLRQLHRTDFLRELMPLAGRDGVELEVALELRGRTLDRGELEAVARALKSLYSPERVLMEGASPGPSDNAALTATLVETLEHWLERRAGLQCHLLVRSASSPPRPLLQALVAAVFQRCPGEWLEASAPGADADAELLDLADCRPLGIPAPPIAPPPDYFAAAGHMDSADPHPGTVPESGVLLGVTRQGDRDVPVRFASSDRARHCYVIGATGTGKSTLLSNMVLQDVRDGAGVCVLDPHGDLQADLMSAIPGSRAADVIPIDLADPDRAIGLNLLEARSSSSRQQVSFAINEILSMFWRLYASIPESMGPAFEQYMRNTLMALAENSRGPGTLADVMLFYENQDFRNAVLGSCSNPAAVSFFRGIVAKTTGEAGFQNIAPYITNKLNRFVGSDYVRPIIAQSRSTLDIRECMDTGKVLLVNLNKGALGGTECSLVGMLLLAKIFSAALERAGQPRADRRPFHLYVDEAQNFLTPIVGSILAEARKFGLTMTLANQNFAQWQDRSSLGLLDSILGNVGTLLMFRVGIDEAERLKSFTRPEFDTRDLQYLPDRTVIAKLLARGRPLPPFTFATLAPMTQECGDGVNEVLSKRLRRNFEQVSRPRDEVETEWREAHRAGHPDQRKTVQ